MKRDQAAGNNLFCKLNEGELLKWRAEEKSLLRAADLTQSFNSQWWPAFDFGCCFNRIESH
jgi:hypothetical protein